MTETLRPLKTECLHGLRQTLANGGKLCRFLSSHRILAINERREERHSQTSTIQAKKASPAEFADEALRVEDSGIEPLTSCMPFSISRNSLR